MNAIVRSRIVWAFSGIVICLLFSLIMFSSVSPGLAQEGIDPTLESVKATSDYDDVSGWRAFWSDKEGYGLAVPGEWFVHTIQSNDEFAVTTFMNYDETLLSGQENWPKGAVKIESMLWSISPDMSTEDWIKSYVAEVSDDVEAVEFGVKMVSLGEGMLGREKALRITFENEQGESHAVVIRRLGSDKLMAFSVTPGISMDQVDVQAMLGSIVFSPDQAIILPESVPMPIITISLVESEIMTIHPCDWGNAAPESRIQPIFMPFAPGTTWTVGGAGSFYGDNMHVGNDYYATDWNITGKNDCGQPVFPIASGTVVAVQRLTTGYGYNVVVDHAGRIRTRYAHLSQINVVNGAAVTIYTQIGTVGSTGTTACHLHMSFLVKIDGIWKSPQVGGERPSKMWTTAGAWHLCDGETRTVSKTGFATTSWIPNNTLIKGANDVTVYLFQNGQKRPFGSPEVFQSWGDNWEKIVTVNDDLLRNLPNGSAMRFRSGTLVKGSQSAVYVIEGKEKRRFCSGTVFESLGYSWSNIVTIGDAVLNSIPTGAQICTTNLFPHPNETLVKTADSGTIYKLILETRRAFPTAEVFLSHGYQWSQVVTISRSEMSRYANASNVQFCDGTLLKGISANVYVIEYGKKRLFTSPEVFEAFGYRWENIMTVSDTLINSIPTGANMNP